MYFVKLYYRIYFAELWVYLVRTLGLLTEALKGSAETALQNREIHQKQVKLHQMCTDATRGIHRMYFAEL